MNAPSIVLACASLFAAVVASCSMEDRPLRDAGDPCRTLEMHCRDELTVMQCVDEEWAEVECTDYCGGLASGVTSDGCRDNACVCVPPPDGCTPGTAACESESTLRWCSESWAWASVECAVMCNGLVPQSESLGCMSLVEESASKDACFCTSEGASCTEDSTRFCALEETLAECLDGVWVYIDCVAECAGEARCNPGLARGAGCECTMF